MDEHTVLEQAVSLGSISFLGSISRVLATALKITFRMLIDALVIGAFVGLLCWFGLKDVKIDYWWKFAITGICSAGAPDIMQGIIRLVKTAMKKPVDFAITLIKR
jgi:hypothetical protein